MPYLLFSTAFGTCGIAWSEVGITGFLLPEESEELAARRIAARGHSRHTCGPVPPWVSAAVAGAKLHFEGHLQDFSEIAIDWRGASEFQRSVYGFTRTVKPGLKTSYGEISRNLGLGPEGARAVGAALAANPWPLLVPCHRVVSAGDKMTGFSAPGGIRTKTRLLVLEGAELLSE